MPVDQDIPSSRHLLLQTALLNHAMEARKRRGRFKGKEKEVIPAVVEPQIVQHDIPEPLPSRSSLEVNDLEFEMFLDDGGDEPSPISPPPDLKRNHGIRRGRPPTRLPPLQQAAQAQVPKIFQFPAERLSYTAPLDRSPNVSLGNSRFSQTGTAPLRIAPKLSITPRFGHNRSLSAPENVTPIDSPGGDSIIMYYQSLKSPGATEDDSDEDSVHSAISEPPSTTVEWSNNIFLGRGDTSASWPSEFPVEALEEHEPELNTTEFAGGLQRKKTEYGALGLKRQKTEVIANLLRDRRQRHDNALSATRPATYPRGGWI